MEQNMIAEVPGIKLSRTMIEQMMTTLEGEQRKSVEVTGGTWDEKSRTYTQTTPEGVITEYKVKRSPFVETGYSVDEKSYKMDGTKKTEVKFDTGTNSWVSKSAAEKAASAVFGKPKWMGSITETRGIDGKVSQSLHIESSRFKFMAKAK